MRPPLLALALAVALAGGAAAQIRTIPGFATGYLDNAALTALGKLPPPPADVSVDRAGYEASRALAGSPRWRLAVADVQLDRDAPARAFACALGRPVPDAVVHLLERVKTDAGAATGPAKGQYARRRPFADEMQPRTCTPMASDQVAQSYPSGHASIGWAWALVLAELAPERAEPILARGRAFGESRIVCGVHFPSDVAAGRDVAGAVVARLHADPAFTADLQAARAALAAPAAKDEAGPTAAFCTAETAAIATPIPLSRNRPQAPATLDPSERETRS